MNNALGYLIELTRATDQPITLLGIRLTWDKVIGVFALLLSPFIAGVLKLVDDRCAPIV